MHSITLDHDNRAALAGALDGGTWVVACLCANWCGTCGSYRASFDQLAARHPETQFVWIDIEDQSEVVGDLDVENFPTLLLQRGDMVAFFGTMLPDPALAERLLLSQTSQSDSELAHQALSTAERREWQQLCNLRTMLADAA
jgi:thioredoxin 1